MKQPWILLLCLAVISSLIPHLTAANKCQISVSGIALHGFVMTSFQADNIHWCYEKCKDKIGCQSINFYRESLKCELNNRTVAAKPTKKVVNSNAVYFEHPRPAVIGSHEEIPAESCMEIKNATNSLVSGLYWVKHAQHGKSEKTYCNMTTGVADACGSSPCKNQGKCENTKENSYNCTCVAPFTGKNCETKV
ncbi:hypothetical protein QZH41_019795 [Actinostola sp. cb2023]|nr:hypothetical protein QZH41_019795 [Actinostola sp. cb2023]